MRWNSCYIELPFDIDQFVRFQRAASTVFLLDSSNKDEEHLTLPENRFLRSKSRYAYIGLNPVRQLSFRGDVLRTGSPEKWESEETCTPSEALTRFEAFVEGGMVGADGPSESGPQFFLFASYEFGEALIGACNPKESLLDMPYLEAWLCADQLVIDWQKKTAQYFHYSENEYSRTEMLWRFQRIFRRGSEPYNAGGVKAALTSNFEKPAYLKAITDIKKYIHDGHVYLLNVSQAFRFKLVMPVEEIYVRMRKRNPAPFGAFFKTPDFAILSTSPERFLRRDADRLSTEPIKGTRPRGATPEEDDQMKSNLLSSIKEQAEHTMVVDLLRNDVGRVCDFGSVAVEDSFYVEKYRTVHQLLSRIVGRLKRNIGIGTILRETYPGGSITGTPKKRAMEIIAEMEPQRRAGYTGILGRHAIADRNFDLSILIRSVIAVGDEAFLSVGGGIVYDSDEEEEYQETLDKGIPVIRALCDIEGQPVVADPASNGAQAVRSHIARTAS